MTIPSVVQGMIETKDGKVFELDSPKGAAWVEAIGSFRFEPSGDGKPCTIRREPSGYWYGCRKVAGKVRKKYIGKTSEINAARLEEIAEALEIPPVSRANKVAEVAEVAEVTQKVTEVAQDRLTALESQVVNLQKAVEALQKALPGKSEAGNSEELPKIDSEVAEGLQNELSNLKMEAVESDLDASVYDALVDVESAKRHAQIYGFNSYEALADAHFQINMLQANYDELEDKHEATKREVAEMRLQLETLRAENEALKATPTHQLYSQITQLQERNRLLHIKTREERQKLEEEIKTLRYRDESQSRRLAEKQTRLDELEAAIELPDPKQRSADASKDLPEAADILNQLKAKRKKSGASLADLELILEMIEKS
jgi:hypothetical protein